MKGSGHFDPAFASSKAPTPKKTTNAQATTAQPADLLIVVLFAVATLKKHSQSIDQRNPPILREHTHTLYPESVSRLTAISSRLGWEGARRLPVFEGRR